MKTAVSHAMCVLAALVVCGVLSRAQDVYVSVQLDINDGCTCADGSAVYDWDYVADIAYILQTQSEMYDAGTPISTFDQSFTGDPNEGDYYEDDTEPMGDEYYIDANIQGTLDSEYQTCATGSCGQHLYNNGGYCTCCAWLDCPSDVMPYDLSDQQSASAPGQTCGEGSSVDNLITEYLYPSAYTIPVYTSLNWVPGCQDVTDINPTPYANNRAFSGGDITNVGVFQSAMLQGLANINSTQIPSGISGLPAQPIPISNVPDVIYRTPYWNWSQNEAHPEEPHQFGLALDFGASSSTAWAGLAAWAEWSNGAQPGGTLSSMCVEPYVSAKPHIHVDWRPSIGMACPATYMPPVPTSWPSH